MFVKGRTAIEGLSGRGRAELEVSVLPATVGRPAVSSCTGDKSEAPARDCLDQALGLAAIADSGAYRVDPRAQRRLGNNTSMPHRREQIVLAHHAFSVLDEISQQVEDLWLDGDQPASATELTAVSVENAIFEPVTHVAFLRKHRDFG
jgi:hypothetical protein